MIAGSVSRGSGVFHGAIEYNGAVLYIIMTRSARWAAMVLAASLFPAVRAQQAQSTPAANVLSAAQKLALQQVAQAVESDTKAQAEALAQKVVPIARRFALNLLSEKPDPELDRKVSADFADAVAELVRTAVQAKLKAMREMVKVLTPEQKRVLVEELDKPGANPDLTELAGKVFGDPKK